MIYSMTGYSNRTLQINQMSLQIDIRSVNHRFLDLTIKCPEEFKIMEQELREIITNKINRGKLDIRINVQENQTENINLNINKNLLSRYSELCSQIQQAFPAATPATTAEIITLPGMLIKNTGAVDTIKPILLREANLLVDDLLHSQMAEGEKLKVILEDKIKQMSYILVKVREVLPTILDGYTIKLKQKLSDLMGDVSVTEQRFQQEFAYFCQKIDVDEEISRLEAHLQQFSFLLNTGGMVGKKIDFLAQEMHREANTFGAKSISIVTTTYSVELKVLIEQIREQIQNIA